LESAIIYLGGIARHQDSNLVLERIKAALSFAIAVLPATQIRTWFWIECRERYHLPWRYCNYFSEVFYKNAVGSVASSHVFRSSYWYFLARTI
jgi:hypothetical protein